MSEKIQTFPPAELERELSSNTLVKNKEQLREEIDHLKLEQEKLEKLDEQLKQNIEVVHEKINNISNHENN